MKRTTMDDPLSEEKMRERERERERERAIIALIISQERQAKFRRKKNIKYFSIIIFIEKIVYFILYF
jgi:hypothetical protein